MNVMLLNKIRVTLEHKHCDTTTVDLITKRAIEHRGLIHVRGWDGAGQSGAEKDNTQLHHASQHGTQFKTHESFVSGIFHVIFSDHG